MAQDSKKKRRERRARRTSNNSQQLLRTLQNNMRLAQHNENLKQHSGRLTNTLSQAVTTLFAVLTVTGSETGKEEVVVPRAMFEWVQQHLAELDYEFDRVSREDDYSAFIVRLVRKEAEEKQAAAPAVTITKVEDETAAAATE